MTTFAKTVPLTLADAERINSDTILVFPSLDRAFYVEMLSDDCAWGGDVIRHLPDGTTNLEGWEWYTFQELLEMQMRIEPRDLPVSYN